MRQVAEQRTNLGSDSDGDRAIVFAQCRAGFDDEALQVEPGAAARQSHCAFGQFQEFAPMILEREPLDLFAKVARRSLQHRRIVRAAQFAPSQAAQHQVWGRAESVAPPKSGSRCHDGGDRIVLGLH